MEHGTWRWRTKRWAAMKVANDEKQPIDTNAGSRSGGWAAKKPDNLADAMGDEDGGVGVEREREREFREVSIG